jgi:hypothetical protein
MGKGVKSQPSTLNWINSKGQRRPFSTSVEFAGFKEKVQEAFNLAKDGLKADTIHLVTIAPAACVIATGMKIQARYQNRIVIY